MDKILVHGGHSLNGSVRISGSKNSALPILAATLLTREPCVISNVPDLSDIHYMLQILSHLGFLNQLQKKLIFLQKNILTFLSLSLLLQRAMQMLLLFQKEVLFTRI